MSQTTTPIKGPYKNAIQLNTDPCITIPRRPINLLNASIDDKFLPCHSHTGTRRAFSALPAHTLQLLFELFVNLAVLRPPFAQSLHSQRCDDSQCGRLELGTALMHRDIGCDTHLRDEVEILLVAVMLLVGKVNGM